jgi:dephospho-CoA kinase
MQMEIEKTKNKVIIVEIPLLVEKNLDYLFDRAIIVNCNEINQLKRLIKRENISEKSAKQQISAQISAEERLEIAKKLPTDVIENNSQIFEMEEKVANLYQKLANL